MRSVHGETIKKALEESHTLTWAELKGKTGLSDVKIKRGLQALGAQVVRAPKKAEIKPGIFQDVMAYTLADPVHILHEIQRELTPLNGLTTTLYMPEKMKRFLDEAIPQNWDSAIKEGNHWREAQKGLAKVADLLGKAQGAFEEYLENIAEERVLAGLPKDQQELYRDYDRCSHYLEFLGERLATVRQERQGSLTDAQISRTLNDTMKEALKVWKDVPEGTEARMIYDAVTSSPGESVDKKLQAYLTSSPDKHGSFGLYFSPMIMGAPSIESVPLTKWEKGELRSLTKGMHIYDKVHTEKWALLADLGERDVVLVKYARRLEQVRLREELGRRMDALFESIERGDEKARRMVRNLLQALDRTYGTSKRSELPRVKASILMKDGTNVPATEFIFRSPADDFIESLSLKHNSISDEETLDSESFVVAKIYAGRERLGPKDRKLVEKLAPMYLKPKS